MGTVTIKWMILTYLIVIIEKSNFFIKLLKIKVNKIVVRKELIIILTIIVDV